MHDFTVHEKLRGTVPTGSLPDMYLPMEEEWKDAHGKDGKHDSTNGALVAKFKALQAEHFQEHQGRPYQGLRDKIYQARFPLELPLG
jgi:hypothetical protein